MSVFGWNPKPDPTAPTKGDPTLLIRADPALATKGDSKLPTEGALPTLLPPRPEATRLLQARKSARRGKSIDAGRAIRAIAEAWKLSGKYSMNFDFALVLVVGQQSAGKTSFVERYLGYAFSVVSNGMATKRPSVLTLLPLQAGSEDEVTVTEERPDGTRSTEEVFKGDEALMKLSKWVADKNTNVAKEKLFITISTQKCKTPRRVMDLPGVRASDEPDEKGINEAIIGMIREAISKPNSIVVCLADAAQEPANDNMVKLFRDREAGMSSFPERLILVLTKADNWFTNTRRHDQVQEHLDRWKKEFYGIEPMLMGSTFDNKADIKDVKVRNCEYQQANQREEQDICKFRQEVMNTMHGEDSKYWDEKVGFKHVQSLVEQLSLNMDMSNLQRIVDKIKQRQKQVDLTLDQIKANRENTNPKVLEDRCSRLVSALLADTIKFLTRSPGACLAVHLSSSRELEETAKTLLQEEEEFMQVWADFSPDSMRAAWKEHKMSNIDYSRADEHAPSEFVDFYQGVLADKKFVGYVKQCEDPLLPGAALPRAAQFFEHMAMQYMYFDDSDVSRIKNARTTNPDMPFVEDNLQRIFILGNIKAAKMRDATMYLVQKTAYLMTEGLACAFSNMKKNEREKLLIEALATGSSTEHVFAVMRRGFIKHLLVHAQHAFVSSVSDHNQFMHQVGEFHRNDRHLYGNTGQWLLTAVDAEVKSLEALKPVDPTHTDLKTGIQEGIKVLGNLPMRGSLPALVSDILKKTKATGILEEKDSDLHKLLGMTAVAFAFFAPQFSDAVVMRCMSGLLGSLDATFYGHDYKESVMQELKKVFISGDDEERLQALKLREDELEEENKDLSQALDKLERLL